MTLRALAELLAGLQIPGGCQDCDAYQTVNQYGRVGWYIYVHHDDTCPWLATHQSQRPPHPPPPRTDTT